MLALSKLIALEDCEIEKQHIKLGDLTYMPPCFLCIWYCFSGYDILEYLNQKFACKEQRGDCALPEGELDWMPAFTEIAYLLGELGSLHIMMVGPEVPPSLSGITTVLNRRVRVTSVQGLYQEVVNDLPLPHLVVAMNSGLENDNFWVGALEIIRAQAVPAFFTDYAEPCCLNAKQVLRAAGLHIGYPLTANPFRSPVRNQMPSTNVPWFNNGFIFGVNL